MGIIKLTQDLENFKWTDYSKVGTPQSFYDGHSQVVTGQKKFDRPDKQALADMESKFGPFNTQPGSRGPYSVADYMYGRKQGRGFTAPGQAPLGFIVDMESLTGGVTSQLDIDGSISLTPLSYVVAGVNSSLDYGVVPEKTIDIIPDAHGAWGVNVLPISTYTSRILSREELEDYTNAPVGGRGVSYYGRLESLYNKNSMFQKEDGTYSTPIGQSTIPGSQSEFQNFMEYGGRGIQRTFIIPAAYPENTSAYTIDSQLGWSHSNKFLETSGTPWSNLPSEWIQNKTTRHEVPWTQAEIEAGWLISDAEGDSRENSFKEVYTTTQTIVHPIQPINLHSVPNYNAPSWLELQFLTSHEDSNGVWPYHTLGFTGTHPLVKKEIGDRIPIGVGQDWMALQSLKTADDTTRINKWLETPKGKAWQEKQHVLQFLNPREETRDWSRSNLILSIPPLFHATRHWGGETYMDKGDFGPIFEGDPPSDDPTMGSLTSGAMSALGEKIGKSESWKKMSGEVSKITDPVGNWASSFAGAVAGSGVGKFFGKAGSIINETQVNFNTEGGRLTFLLGKMVWHPPGEKLIGGAFSVALTNLRSSRTPFGRPPKVPTQTVFSQRGAFGKGKASEDVLGLAPTEGDGAKTLQKYKTLAYGDLPGLKENRGKYDVYEGSLLSPSEILGENIEIPLRESMKSVRIGTPEHYMAGFEGKRVQGQKIVKGIGQQGKQAGLTTVVDDKTDGADLGVIKKDVGSKISGQGYKSMATDKINIHPYGTDLPDTVSDFIKFKFKDIVNNKFIVFRAILSGISDAITPEWSGTQYIGRPDKVYVYKGAERKVSFNFEIFPKTKQEFPILMEKLNYLIGLCYPSFTKGNRMVAPFINLTIGDMFKDTPGFLDSLSIDVDDTGTWEIEDGLQFPKHITCNCSFTYVGKYLPSTLGKHYELNWLTDAGWTSKNAYTSMGTFRLGSGGDINKNVEPRRTEPMSKLFEGK